MTTTPAPATTTTPVRVGLVGAGPWATRVHAPVFAAGPETTLAAVWARRPAAAEDLAARYGATAVGRVEDLYERCDAVAFSVPPAVQADLAVGAAAAGRALVLEKPIAADVAGGERLAAAVAAAGVPSVVVLTWRFVGAVRSFLEQAAGFPAYGGRAAFLSPGVLTGPFRTPWRVASGPLLDLGPHVIDLLDAALGPVAAVRAAGRADRWVSLSLEHDGGAVSQAVMCSLTAVDPMRAAVELYGEPGVVEVDVVAALAGDRHFATLRAEVAAAVRSGRPHPVDVHRGLHLQRLIDAAARQLA